MEGQILGNRYELIEKIGGGGMALVYKAKCNLLNRFVAIKVLRPEFTNDDEFVKRFRIEAQSAASLSHPNIVSIYDVGHEENLHYIVMEYIDGITLKEYITKKSIIQWQEAVNIAIQICSAIEHAHRNHIVHRDIKPHNILLTKEGIAKVTDFGIARAVTSSTITMVGSTIGSVHYFSPEQARGGYTDEKSDLYSLGITLYEMVAGKVPFDGETPVAVAIMHIQNEPIPPIVINPDLPTGINVIIMRAIRKQQNTRYQSASDLLSDFYRVLREPEGDFNDNPNEIDSYSTKRMQVIGGERLSEIKQDLPKRETVVRNSMIQNEEDQQKIKKSKMTVKLAVITSLVIIALIVTFGIIAYTIVTPSNNFIMEDYVGKDYNEIKTEIINKGMIPRSVRKNDNKIGKDIIISQSIEKGRELKSQQVIEFEVSDGPKLVNVPNFRTRDYRDAENSLKSLGLEVKIEYENDNVVGKGLVTRTIPVTDEDLKAGELVTVFVSNGPEIKVTKVPNLIGKTKVEAQKLIADAKLVIGKMEPEDSSNSSGRIINQNPVANTEVNEGTAIDITFENAESGSSQIIERISLTNPESYENKIRVYVEVVQPDTNKVEVVMNELRNKSEFPISVPVNVTGKGSIIVRVYLDNSLYKQDILMGG